MIISTANNIQSTDKIKYIYIICDLNTEKLPYNKYKLLGHLNVCNYISQENNNVRWYGEQVETTVAYFKVLSWYLPIQSNEDYKNIQS